jgi:membrane-bound serine protease (ClpP class)
LCELVFFPGAILPAVTGALLMFGALLWSMVDHWPNQPLDFSGEMFEKPALNLLMGFGVAAVLALLFAKFIRRAGFSRDWRFRVRRARLSGRRAATRGCRTKRLSARRGGVVARLFPGGQIEIDGRRYEARLELGTAVAGAKVVVVRVSDFGLIVEVDKES